MYPDTEQMFVHLFGKSPNAFWLDSSLVEPGLARFSFMGDSSGENSLLIRYQTDPKNSPLQILILSAVRQRGFLSISKHEIERRHCPSDDLPFDFNCGFVGYFGYELKAECGFKLNHPSSLPDAMFLLARADDCNRSPGANALFAVPNSAGTKSLSRSLV